MLELLGNLAGLAGVVMFLAAYWLLQAGKITAMGAPYLLCNLSGALLIMGSLLVDWNLSAFLLEAVWALISIYGLYKHVYLARK